MPDAPETPPVPTPPAPAPEAPATAAETETVDYKVEAEKWKALSRQNEERAKANAEKAAKFEAFEESQKTELQKMQDRLAAADKRASDAEAARLRSDIARTKNVPVELLTAGDQASLEAQAEALLAFRGNEPQKPAGPPSSGPASPSGAAILRSFTDAEIAAMTPEQYQANKADIYAARDAGRITL